MSGSPPISPCSSGRSALRLPRRIHRRVRRLVKAELPAGPHEVAWDGTDGGGVEVTAGSYYLRLTVDGGTGTPAVNRKVVLIR